MPLTLHLLRRRVVDLQVFGWAEVRKVDVAESLEGVLDLSQTFEAAPWKGTANRPTCDFIRGFTTGVFAFAYNRDFVSEETACQGKGDALCRISFRPAA
jgi:predicted hydrocarbon binding protein